MKTRKEYYKCTVFICIHIDTGIRFDLELQARVHPLHFLHALFVVRPEKMRTLIADEESIGLLAPAGIKKFLLIAEEDGLFGIDGGRIQNAISCSCMIFS